MSTEKEVLLVEKAYIARLVAANSEKQQASSYNGTAETILASHWSYQHQQLQLQQNYQPQNAMPVGRTRIYVNPSVIPCGQVLQQQQQQQYQQQYQQQQQSFSGLQAARQVPALEGAAASAWSSGARSGAQTSIAGSSGGWNGEQTSITWSSTGWNAEQMSDLRNSIGWNRELASNPWSSSARQGDRTASGWCSNDRIVERTSNAGTSNASTGEQTSNTRSSSARNREPTSHARTSGSRSGDPASHTKNLSSRTGEQTSDFRSSSARTAELTSSVKSSSTRTGELTSSTRISNMRSAEQISNTSSTWRPSGRPGEHTSNTWSSNAGNGEETLSTKSSSTRSMEQTSSTRIVVHKSQARAAENRVVLNTSVSPTVSPEKLQMLKDELNVTLSRIQEVKKKLAQVPSASVQPAADTTRRFVAVSSSSAHAEPKEASSGRKVLEISANPHANTNRDTNQRKVFLSNSFSWTRGGASSGETCTAEPSTSRYQAESSQAEPRKVVRKVIQPAASTVKPAQRSIEYIKSSSALTKEESQVSQLSSLAKPKCLPVQAAKPAATLPSTSFTVTVPSPGVAIAKTLSLSKSSSTSKDSLQTAKLPALAAQLKKGKKQQVESPMAPKSLRVSVKFTPPQAVLPTRAQLKWTKSSSSCRSDMLSPVCRPVLKSVKTAPASTPGRPMKVPPKTLLSDLSKSTTGDGKREVKQFSPKSLQSIKVIDSKYKFRKVGINSGAAPAAKPPSQPAMKVVKKTWNKLEKVKVANTPLSKSKPKTPVVVSRYKIRKASGLEKLALQSPYRLKTGIGMSPQSWITQHHLQWKLLSHAGRKYGQALWHQIPRHWQKCHHHHCHHCLNGALCVSSAWQASKLHCFHHHESYEPWQLGYCASSWYNPCRHRQQVMKRVRHLHSSHQKSSSLKLDRRSVSPRCSQSTGDVSSRLVMINGFLYRSSQTRLSRTPSHTSLATTASSSKLSTPVVIKKLKGSTMKTVTVRGVKFKMGNSGRTLQRMDASSSVAPSLVEAPSKTGTRVKRVDIGGVTYVQTKPGTLERLASLHSRLRASRVVKSSIARASAKFRKDNTQNPKRFCMFFNRFGKCNRGDDCPYIHDPDKVAVCTRFLRGTCQVKDCPFSHKVSREKMAVCSYFLRGVCSRSDCPYLHVKVNNNAEVCKDFLRGYCPLGSQCKKLHSRVCQPFLRKGTCPQGDQCKLKHIQKKPKKPHSSSDQRDSARTTAAPSSLVAASPPVPSTTDTATSPPHFSSPSLTSSPSPSSPTSPAKAAEDTAEASTNSQSEQSSASAETAASGEGPKEVLSPSSAMRRGLKRLGTLGGPRPVTKMAKLPAFISLAEYSMNSPTPQASPNPTAKFLDVKTLHIKPRL